MIFVEISLNNDHGWNRGRVCLLVGHLDQFLVDVIIDGCVLLGRLQDVHENFFLDSAAARRCFLRMMDTIWLRMIF